MTEKIFRVFTESDTELTSEMIAYALLKQQTLASGGTGAVYGVMEVVDSAGTAVSDCTECEMLSN